MFTREELITLWERASKAEEVTYPGKMALDILDQLIKTTDKLNETQKRLVPQGETKETTLGEVFKDS